MNRTTATILKLAAAASVALAGAALAHPHEGAGKGEKVIVMSKRDGKDGDKKIREFRMMRGPNGEFTCPNGDATKIDETTGGDRTKILICSDDKLSNEERAKKLEESLARIREGDMNAEHKAKVEGALQEAIARLRAGN
ncbi:MAG TPA: hypothetical protein VGB70_14595 [Allosphingosinicella sp.]|jgi:hypothetical protein